MSEYDGFVELAIAITRQAALDYKELWDDYKRTGNKSAELIELEAWFNSEYGKLITFGKGKSIVRDIQRGVEIVAEDYDNRSMLVEYNGEVKSIREWGEIFNIDMKVIRKRLKMRWSVKDALTTPVGGRRGQTSETI